MDSPERWKSIAPATDEPGQQRSTMDTKRKRHAVPVACVPCRTGKSRCDGLRPRCSRCVNNKYQCYYDVAEGVSRAERIKLIKRDGISTKLDELERIIKALRSASDDQASNILARLRLGERVEEVASSLPAIVHPSTVKPFTAGTHDYAESSRSGSSFEPTQVQVERATTLAYRRNSDISMTASVERHASLPGSTSSLSIYTSITQGNRTLLSDSTEGQPFLSIIFDRKDCLLSVDEWDIDTIPGVDGETDTTIDPQLQRCPSAFDLGTCSAESPVQLSSTRAPSLHRDETVRSIHATHLRGRQPIVNALQVYSNLNLRDLLDSANFPNRPAAIDAADTRDVPKNKLFIPTWAMMTLNTRPNPGTLQSAISDITREAIALIDSGTPIEYVIEVHPNIAALFDKDEFDRSGTLSRWAAGMVHSMQLNGHEFTNFASMYLYWYLVRWMIYPSPETYEAVPSWLRPTPNQLFMPHISMLDFVVWPGLRELAVQLPAMQTQMMWLIDLNANIRCDWWSTTLDALVRHEDTGFMDLSPTAKVGSDPGRRNHSGEEAFTTAVACQCVEGADFDRSAYPNYPTGLWALHSEATLVTPIRT